MPDLSPNDLPLWLKIVGGAASVALAIWGIAVAFVEPWADARFVRRFIRCGDNVERHLRNQTFARDYEAVARRDALIAAIDRKTDANQDSVTALTQIAKQQGTSLEKAMSEIPNLSGVIGQLDVTLRGIETTMSRFEHRVEQVADGHNRLSGMIEALRDAAPLPIARPRRKRA